MQMLLRLTSLVRLAADISACCLWQSKPISYWLGSVTWPTACTNLNYQVSCCVKSFLHPLVTLRCDKHSRNILDAFRPHLHLPQSTLGPEVSELLEGFVFLLTRICRGLWAQLPLRNTTPTYICSVSLRLCATFVRDFSCALRRLSNCGFPESDNAFHSSCWDD